MHRIRLRLLSSIAVATAIFTGALAASAEPSSISVSPDVSVDLSSIQLDHNDVGADNLVGIVALESLGNLPPNADVTAYELLPGGDKLFALDTTAEAGGGLIVSPADVVRYDGVAYTLEFEGATNGVPSGVAIDAVTTFDGSDLVLSFDGTLSLSSSSGTIVVDDEDLVRFEDPFFSMLFDGSEAGVAEGLDLDATHCSAACELLYLSFDGSGQLGAVDFDDEDVLRRSSGVYTLSYDGSAQHPGWTVGADLDATAVPEAGSLLLLLSGIGFLSVAVRSRQERG